MNLFPQQILEKIEAHRNKLPELASLDEIWILETMFYEREGYLRFEHFENEELVGSMDFRGGRLFDKFENGKMTLGPEAHRIPSASSRH